jgi:lysophospholipase L1-like esterase
LGRNERLVRAGLSVTAAIAMLAATDPIIRHAQAVPGPGYGRRAELPGSVLSVVSHPDGFSAVHRYNNLGFRGGDFSVTPLKRVRIGCVGDSYTEGVGAQEDQTWPAVVAKELAAADVEVLNLGTAGARPADYARIVDTAAIPLRPTHVIVCFNTNDLARGPGIPPRLGVPDGFGNPFLDDRRWIVRPFARLFPGWLYLIDRSRGRWPQRRGMYWRHFDAEKQALPEVALRERVSPGRARAIVSQRRRDLSPLCLQAAANDRFNSWMLVAELVRPYVLYAARLDQMSIAEEDVCEATRQWLSWYAGTCRSHRIEPWLLYFPLPPLVRDAPYGSLSEARLADRPRVVGDHSVANLLMRLCQEFGVGFIDVTDVLRRHADENLYLRYDAHPTARAYELAGQTVARELAPHLRSGRVEETPATATGPS